MTLSDYPPPPPTDSSRLELTAVGDEDGHVLLADVGEQAQQEAGRADGGEAHADRLSDGRLVAPLQLVLDHVAARHTNADLCVGIREKKQE